MTTERATEQGLAFADEMFRLRETDEMQALVGRALHEPDTLLKLARDRLTAMGLEASKEEVNAFVGAAREKLSALLVTYVKETYFPIPPPAPEGTVA